ncbi:MAG: response regulator [bacterium]|nr:response regulator [bacterium]
MVESIGTLMIIDDDEVDQMLYARVVERSGRVENLIQMEAADLALAFLQSDDCPVIDVILLDLRMPRMDGFEFLEALTAMGDAAAKVGVVVVVLTTSIHPSDRARAAQHPLVAEFWNKPLDEGMIVELCKLLD